MRKSVCQKKPGNGNTGTSGSIYHDTAVFLFLANYLQGIDDAGENNNSSAMLVIMEDRDVQ